ncbi:MAG: HAD family phosphatase [Blautia sp.]|nr:HAD family phosphatase [Blautia sp.]
MAKIRLIASDVDGTLLPEGTPHLNKEYYDVIRKLHAEGITFVAASGRQYASLHGVFSPVDNEIIYVADNGSHCVKAGETVLCLEIERRAYEETVKYARNLENVFTLISTPQGTYTECKDSEMVRWIREGYRIDLVMVEDLLEISLPVLKLAIYNHLGDALELAGPMEQLFGDRVSIMVSGDHWVDIIAKNADKGAALREIQSKLGVTPEETMAFGDNGNDVPLLLQAAESYCVATGREQAKAAAKYVLPNEEDAVLKVLKSLL